MDVGILGGTGPAGRGLALRLADGGASVVLGSRDEERAIEAARALGRQVTGSGAISGSTNAMSAACEVV
ncbi:MAG: NAD(P)-binding domain-containing protein, partial [Acidimicrobiales bacterium]